MQTIIELFEESVAKYSQNPLMWEKTTAYYQSTSFIEIKNEVYKFAAGLMFVGLKKGDRVALLSEGRKAWLISELGILYAGGVNVPLSVKLEEASDLKFRIIHSECKIIIVSKNHSKKILDIKKELPFIEKIIIIDYEGIKDSIIISFDDVLTSGEEFLKTNQTKFVEHYNSIKANDYANICYTSGTTADPKGIILTHRNYTANVEQALTLMNIPEWYISLIILPWDHSFAHTAGLYVLIKSGASIASVQVGKTPMETLKNIPQNIKEIKPHFLLSVPSLAKNFKKNIEKGIRDKGSIINTLFKIGLSIAYAYNDNGWNKGKGLRFLLKPIYKLFDLIIFKKIREGFGGQLRFFIGGGALLDIEFQRFFYAIGMPMFQGYGLSESSPIISSNSEHKHKFGTSGYLVKNLDLKICDDKGNELPQGIKGEIVVKGENIMKGYWKNDIASSEALKNGWLYTGDLGYMDKDGFLYVLGRFKSLLIADDGEKYSPEGIEEAFISNSKYIDQCMLYNNQKAYTILLLVPNKENIKRWASENTINPSTDEGKKAILKQLEKELYEYRKGGKYDQLFPQRWLPAAIGILPEGFTEENQLMNSTLKMVRTKITERYTERIEYLYTPEAKNICNNKNLENITKWFN